MIRHLGCLAALAVPLLACAEDNPALALLEQAQAHYAEAGRKQALADFSHDARFISGTLYVLCVDGKDRLSASGGFPKMVGLSVSILEIGGQRGLIASARAKLKASSDGQIDYPWLNPKTGIIESKRTYFRNFGDDVCGVGTYQPSPTPGPPRRR